MDAIELPEGSWWGWDDPSRWPGQLRRLVERYCGEVPGIVVAFEADAGGAQDVSGLIAAGGLRVVPGQVGRISAAARA